MGEEERVGRVEDGALERVEGRDSGGIVVPLSPPLRCGGRGGVGAVRGGGEERS